MAQEIRRSRATAGLTLALFTMLAVALVALAGCGRSQPSRFFTLESIDTRVPASRQAGEGMTLGFSSISVPAYLQRTQIVLRESDRELRLALHDRWAEQLDKAIPRYLMQALESKPEIGRVALPPLRHPVEPDRRIALDIIRFDGGRGRDVSLLARFAVLDNAGQLTTGPVWSDIRVPTDNDSSEALAKAMGLAMDRLCDEIAAALQ